MALSHLPLVVILIKVLYLLIKKGIRTLEKGPREGPLNFPRKISIQRSYKVMVKGSPPRRPGEFRTSR